MAAGPQERDRLFTIIEAVLLASVALAAAWSLSLIHISEPTRPY